MLATYREVAAEAAGAAGAAGQLGRGLYSSRCHPTLRVLPSLLTDPGASQPRVPLHLPPIRGPSA